MTAIQRNIDTTLENIKPPIYKEVSKDLDIVKETDIKVNINSLLTRLIRGSENGELELERMAEKRRNLRNFY